MQSLQNRLPHPASNRIVRFTTVATDEVNYRPQRYHSNDSDSTISVTAALRDRRDEATPVIMAELKQLLDKHVWHGVRTRDLSKKQQGSIIRSSMFLQNKSPAFSTFERFKARLVAGDNQQD